jgi:hypothetical protein
MGIRCFAVSDLSTDTEAEPTYKNRPLPNEGFGFKRFVRLLRGEHFSDTAGPDVPRIGKPDV